MEAGAGRQGRLVPEVAAECVREGFRDCEPQPGAALLGSQLSCLRKRLEEERDEVVRHAWAVVFNHEVDDVASPRPHLDLFGQLRDPAAVFVERPAQLEQPLVGQLVSA